MTNWLYYGDNLDVLRQHIPSQCVDLVYLDPPFNSNRAYNVIFARHDVVSSDDQAQIQAFDDTWRWTPTTQDLFKEATSGGAPPEVADALMAMRTLLGENDAMAYLVNMTPRLVELHRVLKPTGSLYLHCDPTMSHYLKIMLDAIFGAARFRSEIVWKRTSAHSSAKRWGPVHDILLYYTKGSKWTWNPAYLTLPQDTIDQWYNNIEAGTGRRFNRADLTAAGVRNGPSGMPWRGIDPSVKGRHWAIPGFVKEIVEGLETQDALDALDAAGRIFWPKRVGGMPMLKRYVEESKGIPAQDVITDIYVNNISAERLGYPTQKPVALLTRILAASSNEGDTILDPFCGCGTTIDAAVRLNRRWIGIDITYIAVDLIEKRLAHTHGADIASTYEVYGIPRDLRSARALFDRSPFDFQRWAVSQVNGTPNQRQTGDKGVDGVVRFFTDAQGRTGRALVSVKGGKSVSPEVVRELLGTVHTHRAEMGLLVTIAKPTRGVEDAVNHGGTYVWPVNREVFPKVQVSTIPDLLKGQRPRLPPTLTPYIPAQRLRAEAEQMTLRLG